MSNFGDAAAKPTKPPLKQRLLDLLAEYGRLALYVYFVIFALVFVGFAIALSAGIEVEGATSGAGLIGAAWLATKVTQPIRILVTLAVTPLVGRGLKIWKARKGGRS